MPLIHLTTFIAAPVDRVFDLSRSIELHKHTMKKFEEKPVAGRISGLMQPGDKITWRGKHLLKRRVWINSIAALEKPFTFIYEQMQGDFKQMKHELFFKECSNGTLLIDQFSFECSYGRLGEWFTNLYLTKYINSLLEQRNETIKRVAESNQWKHFLIV
jgi:ligand-binding SRPBCC domain-containing protein